ncbi:MAG: glucosamine-6-phosphate deaminase [Ancylobacter novellus]|uniref:Glucosamine-6-phosphate deaminase n=1 Tax=Ancylobacter novellus TaxID=921 RepID=A0A2W5TCB3_ANCNO|nr:MAG: glucosamine-6-phosphate deaminase [Ancylobacter novellus]
MIDIRIHDTKRENAEAAAAFGAAAIRATIAAHGKANVVVATGASQFEMLDALVAAPGIDWSKVTAFHLDEYIDMPETHPASFRKYLKERFTSKLLTLGAFHFVTGDAADLDAELARMNALLDAHPIDVMFAGIGENGHLAFNDPPADFETTSAYKVVELEERCRQQQFGEGWFPTFDDVPTKAISMTVQRIISAKTVILTVPDERKAEAVQHALEGPVSNMWPASILQQHPDCHAFLDRAAASHLAR